MWEAFFAFHICIACSLPELLRRLIAQRTVRAFPVILLPPGWARPALGLEPWVPGRDSVGAANWSSMARCARRVPSWVHVLASLAEVGRTRRLAGSVAEAAFPAGRAPVAGLGRSLPRRHLHHREKGGSAVGTTRRGKGTKCMWWSTAAAYLSERNLRPRRSPGASSRRARSAK